MWLPVIGKALAHLCMHNADMENKTLAEKARFLGGLGLDRKDVAEMLGTTEASIRELMRQAQNRKKGAKKSAGRKTKAR